VRVTSIHYVATLKASYQPVELRSNLTHDSIQLHNSSSASSASRSTRRMHRSNSRRMSGDGGSHQPLELRSGRPSLHTPLFQGAAPAPLRPTPAPRPVPAVRRNVQQQHTMQVSTSGRSGRHAPPPHQHQQPQSFSQRVSGGERGQRQQRQGTYDGTIAFM
jgi:hypothetical protein